MSGNCITRIINARLAIGESTFTASISVRGYRYMRITQINMGVPVVGNQTTHLYLLHSSITSASLGSFFEVANACPNSDHMIGDIEGTHTFDIFDVTTGLPLAHAAATTISVTFVFHN